MGSLRRDRGFVDSCRALRRYLREAMINSQATAPAEAATTIRCIANIRMGRRFRCKTHSDRDTRVMSLTGVATEQGGGAHCNNHRPPRHRMALLRNHYAACDGESVTNTRIQCSG